MLITFLNVPGDICWNDGVEMMFLAEMESILGSRPDLDTIRVQEKESKVHVMIFEAPIPFPVISRKATAKQVFLFLKYHGILPGADVYFSDFAGEANFDDRYFAPSDVELG